MDSWSAAADRIAEQRRQREAAEAEACAAEDQRLAAERAAAEAARVEMEEAIAAATADLENFMRRRGAAAMKLLAAANEYILFGCDSGGGQYSSVYIDGSKIGQEVGKRAGYGTKPISNNVVGADTAVRYFAYYGIGVRNPQKVCEIVKWLEGRIDAIARACLPD